MANTYGVRNFPIGHFSRATSKVTVSRVATSQMCHFPSDNFPKVRLGPLRPHRLLDWVRIGYRPSAAARIDLGSCRSGNCTFRMLPIRKNPLEKYLTYINYLNSCSNVLYSLLCWIPSPMELDLLECTLIQQIWNSFQLRQASKSRYFSS